MDYSLENFKQFLSVHRCMHPWVYECVCVRTHTCPLSVQLIVCAKKGLCWQFPVQKISRQGHSLEFTLHDRYKRCFCCSPRPLQDLYHHNKAADTDPSTEGPDTRSNINIRTLVSHKSQTSIQHIQYLYLQYFFQSVMWQPDRGMPRPCCAL